MRLSNLLNFACVAALLIILLDILMLKIEVISQNIFLFLMCIAIFAAMCACSKSLFEFFISRSKLKDSAFFIIQYLMLFAIFVLIAHFRYSVHLSKDIFVSLLAINFSSISAFAFLLVFVKSKYKFTENKIAVNNALLCTMIFSMLVLNSFIFLI